MKICFFIFFLISCLWIWSLSLKYSFAGICSSYLELGKCLYFDLGSETHSVFYELPNKRLNWIWYVILWVSGVFWSFLGFGGIFVFRGYFCHFLSFGGILVIFGFWRYFGHFFGFWGHFGNFLGFRGILIIFWVLALFWAFSRFKEYFGHFLGFGGILVIFGF